MLEGRLVVYVWIVFWMVGVDSTPVPAFHLGCFQLWTGTGNVNLAVDLLGLLPFVVWSTWKVLFDDVSGVRHQGGPFRLVALL